MDRQEFNRLVFEKLSSLNPKSLVLLDEVEDSVTIEVVSNSFTSLSVLKRINKVYELISNEILAVDFNVDFITLTEQEKLNNLDDQFSNSSNSTLKNTGYAAQEVR